MSLRKVPFPGVFTSSLDSRHQLVGLRACNTEDGHSLVKVDTESQAAQRLEREGSLVGEGFNISRFEEIPRHTEVVCIRGGMYCQPACMRRMCWTLPGCKSETRICSARNSFAEIKHSNPPVGKEEPLRIACH